MAASDQWVRAVSVRSLITSVASPIDTTTSRRCASGVVRHRPVASSRAYWARAVIGMWVPVFLGYFIIGASLSNASKGKAHEIPSRPTCGNWCLGTDLARGLASGASAGCATRPDRPQNAGRVHPAHDTASGPCHSGDRAGRYRAAAFYTKVGWQNTGVQTYAVETASGPLDVTIWRFEKRL